MQCEMCGSEKLLSVANVEGVEMSVCEKCAKFGTKVKKTSIPKPIRKGKFFKAPREKEKKSTIIIVSDYASKIRFQREKLKLTQEQFGKKINERSSLVNHVESGKMKPSIRLAQKLERIFKFKLTEEYEDAADVEMVKASAKSGNLTIGDLIKKR